MAVQFFSEDVTYQTPQPKVSDASRIASVLGDIADSSSVSGVELRILPPFIKDNNTPKVPLFPGRANLYCLVVVVGDVGNQLVGDFEMELTIRDKTKPKRTLRSVLGGEPKDQHEPDEVEVLMTPII